MKIPVQWTTWLLGGVLVLLIGGSAAAQTNSAIAGVVKDATGAVLPGVTVEVSSPALIEKVRTAVTDGSGQYRIVELRPGVYAVSFSLPGFSTVVREGIELTTGFTATVGAELKVGTVAESITVSGTSPVVDVQNVVSQRVLTRDVLDVVPSGKNFANLAVLIPGTTITGSGRGLDVGGAAGHANQRLIIHGGNYGDQLIQLDGMSVATVDVTASFTTLAFPDGLVEEMNLGIGSHMAETETGGVRVNIIPKSGGNSFKGSLFGSYAGAGLQSDNLTDSLKAQGLTAVNRIRYLSDVNPSAGGPIVQDRLWVYGGYRDWRTATYTPFYYDANPSDYRYTPDLSRGNATRNSPEWNTSARVTWQASAKDKFAVNFSYDNRCECTGKLAGTLEPTTMPEADIRQDVRTRVAQVTWTRPATNRILLEGGLSRTYSAFDDEPLPGAVGPPALELSTGYGFRSRGAVAGLNEGYPLIQGWNYVARGSLSYVTGTHALKFGFFFNPSPGNTGQIDRHVLGDYLAVMLNGVPNRAEFYAMPYTNIEKVSKRALFAQDQWTARRLTLNLGLRFDWHKSSYEGVTLPATDLLPQRQFTGADVLNWKDLSPRLGASYDLSGDGKTALKVSFNRYVAAESNDLAKAANPVVTSTARLVRSWVDSNGDFIPQGNPLDPLPNGELGPSTNFTFGQPVTTLTYDPKWTNGWGLRGYNWELSASAQHEILPRVSVNGAYIRRMYGNLTVIDNLAVSPSNYDPFCVTTPADARLPGGGGQQLCDLYDLNPSKLGQVNRFQTLASNYGDQVQYWHGVDLTVDARLPRGVLLQGGVSTGRTVTDNCDVVTKLDNPSRLYCHTVTPFLPNIKLLGSYRLPAEFQVAATFQSIPGDPVSANFVATNAQIRPSLGRNLSSGANGTATVNLIEPSTLLSDRVDQLDLRLMRTFKLAHGGVKAMFDLYNVSNASPVIAWNNTYGTNGSAWRTPLQILGGRIIKFSAQLDF